MSYAHLHPLLRPIPADRQGAKRHYGVHPYFTRRPYNVVRKYILHYSREGDAVLDPFGGSGVTAIEAWLENRFGIHNDINPLANFIAEGIFGLEKGTNADYRNSAEEIDHLCRPRLEALAQGEEQTVGKSFADVRLPGNFPLPRSSDVRWFHDLFSKKQLYALALLSNAIDQKVPATIRPGFMLAWSATAAKLNRTFLSAQGRAESRGGSSIFSIYRYKVAKQPVELPAWATFSERLSNVIAAKREVDKCIEAKRRTGGWKGRHKVHSVDCEELGSRYSSQIDYIFTDPPYGGHIAYLDLSVLWNGWFGSLPDTEARGRELIVGGEFGLSEASYLERLGRSVQTCVQMLKPGRWLSIVFQHWNTAYFEAILSSAARSGADLRAAVSQVGDPIWSMHKKKGSDSVLAGEMILTFCKTGEVQQVLPRNQFDVAASLLRLLQEVETDHVFGEYIFNRMIVDAWRSGAIDKLNVPKDAFSQLMKDSGWTYDERHHYWVRSHRSGMLLPLPSRGEADTTVPD